MMEDERDQAGRYAGRKQDHAESDRTWRAVDRISNDFPFALSGLSELIGPTYSHAEEPPVPRILCSQALLLPQEGHFWACQASTGSRCRCHRRSDGGPEHRYEWYTGDPPYVSRPNDNQSSEHHSCHTVNQ